MDNLARIQAFKEFSIHNRIDPFSEDIEAYYDNPHEFYASEAIKASVGPLARLMYRFTNPF